MKLEVTKNTDNTRDLYILEWFKEGESVRKVQLYQESFKALEEYFKPKKDRKKKQPAPPPNLQEVKDFFKLKGYSEDTAIRFFDYYTTLEWYDNKGQAVLKWKAKAISTWLKPENKLKEETKSTTSFFQK